MSNKLKINNLHPYKTQKKTLIHDGNLQINASNNTEHLDDVKAFHRLLSYYAKEVHKIPIENISKPSLECEEVQSAMEEAESTFKSMMEISKQLREACNDIIQLKP